MTVMEWFIYIAALLVFGCGLVLALGCLLYLIWDWLPRKLYTAEVVWDFIKERQEFHEWRSAPTGVCGQCGHRAKLSKKLVVERCYCPKCGAVYGESSD